MYTTCFLLVIHRHAKFGMPMSKGKDDPAHTKIYCEYAIWYWDQFSRSYRGHEDMWHIIHGDTCTLMCQIWYDYVNRQKSCGLITKPFQKPYKFDLEGKDKHPIQIIYSLMVITPCAKYGMLISKQTEVMVWTRRHFKTSINLTLRSKFKVLSGSWMYVTHPLNMIDPCAKYGKPMSKQKQLWAGHEDVSKTL